MNESKATTTEPTNLKKKKKEQYEQLHDKNFKNLDDKDKFLGTHTHTHKKKNQEEKTLKFYICK